MADELAIPPELAELAAAAEAERAAELAALPPELVSEAELVRAEAEGLALVLGVEPTSLYGAVLVRRAVRGS